MLGHDEEEGWFLEGFDGTRTRVFLEDALHGHRGRIGCVTKFSAQKMRESLEQSGHQDVVESLGTKLSDMQSVLERLKNV